VEYLWVPCSFLQQSGPRYVEVTSQGAVVLVPVRINSNLKAMTVEELLGQKKSMHVTAFRHFVHDELPHDLRRIADSYDAEARYAADLRTEKNGRVYSVQARPTPIPAHTFLDSASSNGIESFFGRLLTELSDLDPILTVLTVCVAQDLLSSIMRDVRSIMVKHEKLDCNMCVDCIH
jgi:hypothetical protein